MLKIGSIGGVKFGIARKMLYLCIVNRWSSESHESSLSNGRVATEMDEVNQKTGAQSITRDYKAVSGGPMQIVAS